MKGVFITVVLGAFTAGLASAGAQDPRTSNAPLPSQAMRVGDLERRDIYAPQGERLGSVRDAVLDVTDGRTFLVVEHGGVAGLGEKEFPLPVERVFLQDGRLVVPSLTEAELEAVADWDIKDQRYREMADSEIINIARR